MSYPKEDSVSLPITKFILFFTVMILIIGVARYNYSQNGYTYMKYQDIDSHFKLCIEGEVNPTNQTVSVVNDGEQATENAWIRVNNATYLFEGTIAQTGFMQKIDSLKVGCNDISIGSQSNTQFEMNINYVTHYRPIINYLEIGNMKVGHNVRYFIATQNFETQKINRSRLNITDVTRTLERRVFYDEFEGAAIRFKMDEPGNYRADMQVFDGEVWSDIYQSSFQSHVIVTDEQSKATRTFLLEDDMSIQNDLTIPIAIEPDERDWKKEVGRTANGGYHIYLRVKNLVLNHINQIQKKYLN